MTNRSPESWGRRRCGTARAGPAGSGRWARWAPCSTRPARVSWPTRSPWLADPSGSSPWRTRPPLTSASRSPSPPTTVLPVPWMRRSPSWPRAGSACARTNPCPCSRPPRPTASWKAAPSTSASSSPSRSAHGRKEKSMSTHFHVSGTGVTGPLARRASGNYKWWVLVTAIFGAFVSLLDATVVNTALPHIQLAFGTDLHTASYVVTGYLLAQGVVIAASGFLANRFGIKRVYLLSLALFTLGSALCGLAWNIDLLIFFRVLQGAGGAALFPLSFSLVFGAFPEEQRGLANGIFGIPVLVAPALGPVIGGYLAQYVDWRWIFYLNLPIG